MVKPTKRIFIDKTAKEYDFKPVFSAGMFGSNSMHINYIFKKNGRYVRLFAPVDTFRLQDYLNGQINILQLLKKSSEVRCTFQGKKHRNKVLQNWQLKELLN